MQLDFLLYRSFIEVPSTQKLDISFLVFDNCLQFNMILHDHSKYSFIYLNKTKLLLILAIKSYIIVCQRATVIVSKDSSIDMEKRFLKYNNCQ